MFLFWMTLVWCSTPLDSVEEISLRQMNGAHLKPYVAHYVEKMDGKSVGQRQVSLMQAVYPGGPGFRSVIAMMRSDTVYDEHRFLSEQFQPVARLISCQSLLHQIEVYGQDGIHAVKMEKDGTNPQALDLKVRGERYLGSLPYLLAGMKLEKGMILHIPIYSSDLGPNQQGGFAQIEVLGQEKVVGLDGKTYETWLVSQRFLDLDKKPLQMGDREMPPSRHWISHQPPYAIQSQFGPMTIRLKTVTLLPELEP